MKSNEDIPAPLKTFSDFHLTTIHCALISLVVVGLWSTGTTGEFLWIDHVEIEQAGYRITSQDDWNAIWSQSLDSYLERDQGTLAVKGGYFRPVYGMLISLEWAAFGSNPQPYHWVSVILHLATVFGLYVLGRLILNNHVHRINVRSNLAFFAAILFATHPFGVHSVTWISGQKDLLCTLLSLAVLIPFGMLQTGTKDVSLKLIVASIAGLACLFLAQHSKESAFIVPVFMSAWLWVGTKSKTTNRFSLIYLITSWAITVFCLILRSTTLGAIGLTEQPLSESAVVNLANSAQLLCIYAVRSLTPWAPTIVDRWEIQSVSTNSLPGVLVALLLIGLTFWLICKRNQVSLCLTWFLLWIAPVLGLVPLRHVYAERYMYPASWGLVFLFVISVHHLQLIFLDRAEQKTLGRLISPGLFGLSLAVYFAMLTLTATPYWNDDSALFEHALTQDENYVEGLSFLAFRELERENYSRALEYSESAIQSMNDKAFRSYSSPFMIYTNAGLAAYHANQLQKAIGYFRSALRSRPQNALSYFHIGLALEKMNQLANAESAYRDAIHYQSNHHPSRVNLARLLLVRGQAKEVIEILQPTIRSEPKNELALASIGGAYLLEKNFAEAESAYQALFDLKPDDAVNLAKLAWVEFNQQKLQAANRHISQAIQLDPNNPTVNQIRRLIER